MSGGMWIVFLLLMFLMKISGSFIFLMLLVGLRELLLVVCCRWGLNYIWVVYDRTGSVYVLHWIVGYVWGVVRFGLV